MAEDDYRRLAAPCSCGGLIDLSRSLRRKRCDDCRRVDRRPGMVTREQYRAQRAASRPPPEHCERCGDPFRRGLGGQNKARGYANRFCSRLCYNETRRTVASEIDFLRRLARQAARPEVERARERTTALRLLCRAIKAVARDRQAQKAPCSCGVCGAALPTRRHGNALYCSAKCRNRRARETALRSPVARARRRAAKYVRRALQRKARRAERFDPIKVLERDRWRCQLCGCRTPKTKRGTCEPDAPELDHVIPLSRGGAHSYANTQCACRSCNVAKGATARGQLGLDFAAPQ